MTDLNKHPLIYLSCNEGLLEKASDRTHGLARLFSQETTPRPMVLLTTHSGADIRVQAATSTRLALDDLCHRLKRCDFCTSMIDDSSQEARHIAKRLCTKSKRGWAEISLPREINSESLKVLAGLLQELRLTPVIFICIEMRLNATASSIVQNYNMLKSWLVSEQSGDAHTPQRPLLALACLLGENSQPSRFISLQYQEPDGTLDGAVWYLSPPTFEVTGQLYLQNVASHSAR